MPSMSARSMRTVWSTPSALAVSSLNGVGAATVTEAAPPLLISCARSRPVGPAPKTSAVAPGRIWSDSRPCMAQAAGSVKTAVSGWMPSTEKTRSSRTVAYSAKNPGKLLPSPFMSEQRMRRPARQ